MYVPKWLKKPTEVNFSRKILYNKYEVRPLNGGKSPAVMPHSERRWLLFDTY